MLGLAAFSFGVLAALSKQLPHLDPSRQRTEANSYLYDSKDERVLAILRGDQARVIVPSARISPWIKHAIVAAEDKRFYEHRGVDVRGMARALWADVSHRGTVQGGSTITQQFVKNAYLTTRQTVTRKLVEAALAWQLEQKWSKDKILTAYLNTVYFGNGAYGVQQASKIYFHHGAATMKPAEAALLAGIPEDPSAWDPVAHPKAAKDRRNLVLEQMYEQGYLTNSQYRNSLVYPMPDPSTVTLPATQSVAAPFFANYVKDQLVEEYGTRRTFGGGLKVTTTIDLRLQAAARDALSAQLPTFASDNGPTGALVAIDPRTGAVLAMVGGPNYHQNQFNLATQGERQPGSAFKPFVLATALREGISPSSTLTSSKQVTIDAGGRLWVVNNYEGEALGPIDLTKAIAYSDNSVFSQLTALVGPSQVAQTAHEVGITSPLKGYFAIGLGAEPATPLEMARAYATFANGGARIDGSIFGNEPRAISSVEVDGKTEQNSPVPKQKLTENEAATINQLLQGVVQYGTGVAAQLPGREVAGKTGTTENYGDAWFVGYTPQLVVAVWVGYPHSLVPMTTEFHGKPVLGGTFPALIWKAFMQKALSIENDEPESFAAPEVPYAAPVRVVNRGGVLERDNGVCKNTYLLEFYGGVGPKRTADCKVNEVQIPNVVGESIAQAKARLQGQPLTATFVYKPARTGERLGIVLGQFPKRGTASAYDTIRLVLPKSLHGVVPKVVGLAPAKARAKLAKLHLEVHIVGGSKGRVVAQSPAPQTAAAPGMPITLTVRAGTGG